MKHNIRFEETGNRWDNALPLGNGVFGCMVYYEDGMLHQAMNHYEVYYNISGNVLPCDKLKNSVQCENPGELHAQTEKKANDNQPVGDEPYCDYHDKKETAFDMDKKGLDIFSSTFPQTGELIYSFSDIISDAENTVELFVEDAKTRLTLKKDGIFLCADTVVAREDCVITSVKQERTGLVKSIKIDFPKYARSAENKIEYRAVDNRTVLYTVNYGSVIDDSRFEFCGAVRFAGAECSVEIKENGAEIKVLNDSKEFKILTGIFTDWRYAPVAECGLKKIIEFENKINKLYDEHARYWEEFFARSSVTLPDKFLEQVYFINLYALDCCSGKDGIMKHQACGLNGLWAIRHPNLWGSEWYWDVNIQAAFAGVFSGNRLDLAKVFSDGLLSYSELSERFAKDVHNITGVSGDYPYPFYYCIMPWCAQYLWYLYEYSMDKDYLRNEAYPLFVKLCEFFVRVFKYDGQRGYYSIYPDISPEQGPLAHDTTITVAAVKYLFKFTLEAAEILDDNQPVFEKVREIAANMAPYALSKEGTYGVHFKDSADAPDNMWIRHPSMLMPLFPIGEFGLDSGEEIKSILSNTIDFLEDRCEIGIFGGSWLAAAAARLGRGQTALRLLYERGIDHMLRSNGLSAEETSRFMNYCLIVRQPLYYPCMMEFTGEMLAAVNEMLLQSHNGVIRVFPAVPDGNREWGRFHRHGYSIADYSDRCTVYEAWSNVRIDKLLAKGAFEISAELKNGELKWIAVKSLKGGRVRVTSPFIKPEMNVYSNGEKLDVQLEEGILSFDTETGYEYIVAEGTDAYTAKNNEEYGNGIMSHETYTKHRLFMGGNLESEYQKCIDGFIRDRYLGNCRIQNHTVHKFDFTKIKDKNYSALFIRQTFAAEEMLIPATPFEPVSGVGYSEFDGYGFVGEGERKITDRNGPDELRRDFAEGEESCEFVLDIPRGQYELLVISGDEEEDSVTCLNAVNGRKTGGEIIKKGCYQCKVIPIVQEKDEYLRLKISTANGYRWKINAIFLNILRGY